MTAFLFKSFSSQEIRIPEEFITNLGFKWNGEDRIGGSIFVIQLGCHYKLSHFIVQIQWRILLFSSKCWMRNCYKILHMTQQLACHWFGVLTCGKLLSKLTARIKLHTNKWGWGGVFYAWGPLLAQGLCGGGVGSHYSMVNYNLLYTIQKFKVGTYIIHETYKHILTWQRHILWVFCWKWITISPATIIPNSCMHPASKTRCYIIKSYLIGWAHPEKDPCKPFVKWVLHHTLSLPHI